MINQRVEILLEKARQVESKRMKVLQLINNRQPYCFQPAESAVIAQSKNIQSKLNQTNNSIQSLTQKLNHSAIEISKTNHYEDQIYELKYKILLLQKQNKILQAKLKYKEEQVHKLSKSLSQQQVYQQQAKKKTSKLMSIKQKLANININLQTLKGAQDKFKQQTAKQLNGKKSYFLGMLKQQITDRLKQQQQQQEVRISKANVNNRSREQIAQQKQLKNSRFQYQVFKACGSISRMTSIDPFPEDELITKFPSFSQSLLQHLQICNFLTPSSINMTEEMRKWLFKRIEQEIMIDNKALTYMLYRYDGLNKVNFHHYFDKRPNILLIVKLQNGTILGGFTHYAFNKERTEIPGKGFIFNLSRQLSFPRKRQATMPVAYYDDYYIGFGNSELRIRSMELSLFSNFGISSGTFDSLGFRRVDFTGSTELETGIESFEIHEVIGGYI